MNWSDEDIDHLFRTGANDIKPVYDPAFWDEMEAMLPVEKKRSPFPWFWTSLSAVVALLGIAGFNWFFSSEKSTDFNAVKLSQANAIVVSEQRANNSQTIQTADGTSATDSNPTAIQTLNSTKKAERKTRKQEENIPPISYIPNLEQTPTETDNSDLLLNSENDEISTTSLAFLPISWENGTTSLGQQSLGDLFANRKKRAFYVDFGVGAGQSFVKNANASPQMNASVGAGMSYFPSRFGFSLGAQFNAIQPSDLVLNRRSKVYSFSSTDYTQRLHYKQLYTVSIPMNLMYKTARSRFEIGVSPSYVVQTQLAFTSSINGEMDQTGTALNADLGLNRFNVLGQVGYHVSLSKNWAAGVRISTWLTQPTQEGVFESKTTRLPTQGQFTLTYSL